jgi:hypothetical protein
MKTFSEPRPRSGKVVTGLSGWDGRRIQFGAAADSRVPQTCHNLIEQQSKIGNSRTLNRA